MQPFGISENGLRFIASNEAFRANPYMDSAGVWTIGFGTTHVNMQRVSATTPPITVAQAYNLLQTGLINVQTSVNKLYLCQLTQNKFDALCSFAYNVGIAAFEGSSLFHQIASGNPVTEDLFTRWNKIHDHGSVVPLPGLTHRREREYALFIS